MPAMLVPVLCYVMLRLCCTISARGGQPVGVCSVSVSILEFVRRQSTVECIGRLFVSVAGMADADLLCM